MLVALLAWGSLGPRQAWAFVVATAGEPGCVADVDEGCDALRWPSEDPVPFRLHYRGGTVPDVAWEAAVRQALGAWAGVEGASLRFEEGEVFVGDPCPDGPLLDGEGDYEEHCPGRTEEVDFESVFSFMTESWPFGPEVIAQTTVSWDRGGVLVDADIAFNAVHYQFTSGDEEVATDLLSILTHESGHMLGLSHSAEPEATMFAVYEQGQTHLRSLDADDERGIAWLYPCEDAPCDGSVGWEGGCELAGPLIPGAAILFLLPLIRRSGRRARVPLIGLCFAAATVLAPPVAQSTLVRPLGIEELVAAADLVVRARVSAVEPYRRGIVRHTVDLEVTESWKGLAPEHIRLDQPGGRLGAAGTLAFGTPKLAPGEDVVLLLSWPEAGEPRVLGLALGAFHVKAGGTLSRDLDGIHTVSGRVPTAPASIEGLRAYVGGGESPRPTP